ncbi:DUF3558 domain-containing protein [Kutzneria sp. NPDC051319]|uniref:DUF3558 domain-containing protein n=1 Tax=Kutzneria sp. NPDC051319 TaxID=3155047 RepID=UPI003414D56C
MRTGTRIGVAVILTAVAAAGCTTQDPGTASPTTSTGSATTPSVSIPPRPKTLNAASVDPCTLLSDTQIAQLKASAGHPGPGEAQSGTTASCTYQVNDPVHYTISARIEPKRGIDYWLTYTGTWQVRQTAVSSFPAVQIIYKGEDWNGASGTQCRTLVSIADGQELSSGVIQTGKDLTMNQMCDVSKQAAGLALTTLLAKS